MLKLFLYKIQLRRCVHHEKNLNQYLVVIQTNIKLSNKYQQLMTHHLPYSNTMLLKLYQVVIILEFTLNHLSIFGLWSLTKIEPSHKNPTLNRF